MALLNSSRPIQQPFTFYFLVNRLITTRTLAKWEHRLTDTKEKKIFDPTQTTPCDVSETATAGGQDPHEIEQTMSLQDGYAVSKVFYNCIRLQVEDVLPALQPDDRYTLKTLCGKEFWGQLAIGERRMAGRCMAHMVVIGLLPLSFADSKHEYPKWYRLK